MPRRLTAAVVGLTAATWWLATGPVRRGWGGLAAGGAAEAVGGPIGLAVAPTIAALTRAARSAECANTLPA